jgi:hypothetical protein
MEYMYLLMHIMAKVLNNNGKLDSLLENWDEWNDSTFYQLFN